MGDNNALLILGIVLFALAFLCAVLQIIQLAKDKVWFENSRRKLAEGSNLGIDVEAIMKRKSMPDFMMCYDAPTQIIISDSSAKILVIQCVFSKIAGIDTNRVIEIQSDKVFVGREQQSQIHIDDMRVSRRHCIITQKNDKLWIADCESCNGTYVNGERIFKETELGQNSLVKVGDSEFNIKMIANV